jgi:hypothetical protein
MGDNEELVRYSPGRTLTPVMNLTLAKSRLVEFQNFVKEYMVAGEDYGQIPGTPKPTLYKPGADKLCELYGLSDSYKVIDRLVDFDRGLFDYEIECQLSRDGVVIATGLGSCSSFEGKYRWRDSKQKCPKCGKETIIKGKEEFGGGWICFAKKGGCGAKFPDGDEAITSQVIGQVENEDIATLKNTILKMAKKRAKVDATLAATRSSGVFTQDINDPEPAKPTAAPIQQPQRKSETQPQQTPTAQSPPSQPQPGNGAPVISDAQIKRLWAIGYAANQYRKALNKDGIIAIIKGFGYDHADKIKKTDYEIVVKGVETGQMPTADPDPITEREPGSDDK